jgi:hypothetical protein
MSRAIKELAKLDDHQFFDEIATGLQLVADVVKKIDDAATHLSDDSFTSILTPEINYPAPILSVVGAEEAAKTLILIDSVRCPISKSKERTRTLGYFYDHLAKSIYAEACDWHPANFAELSRLIELDRQMYYLDGPTGADWIFFNQNLQRREDALYVGYIRDETAASDDESSCSWTNPLRAPAQLHSTKNVFGLCSALRQIGLFTSEALKVVAEVWRSIEMRPETSHSEVTKWNTETLEKLQTRGFLPATSSAACDIVIEHWFAPLWSIEVGTPPRRKNPKH